MKRTSGILSDPTGLADRPGSFSPWTQIVLGVARVPSDPPNPGPRPLSSDLPSPEAIHPNRRPTAHFADGRCSFTAWPLGAVQRVVTGEGEKGGSSTASDLQQAIFNM